MLRATGEGVSKDTDKALHLMAQASRGGNVMADDFLDMLNASMDGRFTTQQQRYWVRKAAELGIREAQEELGMFYNRDDQ
jgi:TPR repeat protein